MDINRTIENLRNNEFEVSYFETGEEAARYLDEKIDGKIVGFGDSVTLTVLDMNRRLSSHNTVYDPAKTETDEEFLETARKTLMTDVFILSANGVSETGELVNIDGTGNRVASSLFGHEKVYFVVGVNKIAPTLEEAIHRARNIAAPRDAKKLGYKTPCAVKGDRCYDCHAPGRICNALTVYLQKMNDMDMEVVIINEELGF